MKNKILRRVEVITMLIVIIIFSPLVALIMINTKKENETYLEMFVKRFSMAFKRIFREFSCN